MKITPNNPHPVETSMKRKMRRLTGLAVLSGSLFSAVASAQIIVIQPDVLEEINQNASARVIVGLKVEQSQKPSPKSESASRETAAAAGPEAMTLESTSSSPTVTEVDEAEMIARVQEQFLRDLGQSLMEVPEEEEVSAPETEPGTDEVTDNKENVDQPLTLENDSPFPPVGAATPTAKPAKPEKPAKSPKSPVKFTKIPHLVLEQVDKKTLSKIKEHPLVTSVELDAIVPPLPVPAWNVTIVGADQAWMKGYAGEGQAVAILDSGVDKTHTALSGKVISEACYSSTYSPQGASTVCPDGSEAQVGEGAGIPCDADITGCDHGTHVAGIVAGNDSLTQGVAKDANIIAIQVFSRFADNCGPLPVPCAMTYTSDQIQGLERVLELSEEGLQIAAVNMSLGGGKYEDYCDNEQPALKAMIDQLRSVGIATLIASGNNGFPDAISSPACISSAISVGATNQLDQVAYYSNSAEILELLAPGSEIRSSVPGGGTAIKSGTSMATPEVAGAWAILKPAARSTQTVEQILDALKRTGKPLTDLRNGLVKPRIQVDEALAFLTQGSLLAVDMYNQLWRKTTLTGSWQFIPNSGFVRAVTTLADGTILAVGTDNQLWTRTTLTSPWQHVSNSGSVIDVTQMTDGTILGVGIDNQLWFREDLTKPWQPIPNSGSVKAITTLLDGSLLGVGMDNQLWTKAPLNTPWQPIPNSGSVIDVTVMKDGTVVGVGTDNQLWAKATLTSPWQWVPNNGVVMAVTWFD